jgi:nucleotide-binding universal stress UspA family protein
MTVAATSRMSALSHVVVGYDFSHSGHAALTRAVSLAARATSHVLHVICVVDPKTAVPSLPSYGGIDYMYAARVQEALASAVQQELEKHDISRVHFFVYARIGRASEEILNLAREVGADLIIVGSHDAHGLERLFVGSTSSKVTRDARCSVEIARPKQYPDVELMAVVEVEPDRDHPYLPPHRYTYEDRRLNLRPPEWPLY